MARRAGFKTVANSEFHANSPATSRYKLGRVALLRDLSINEFSAHYHGHELWKKRLSRRSRPAAQQLLGNRMYDRARVRLCWGNRARKVTKVILSLPHFLLFCYNPLKTGNLKR